jgi:hypothetical protein
MKRWQDLCANLDTDKATLRYTALSHLKGTWILDLRLNTVATGTVIHSPLCIGSTQSRSHLHHEYAYCSFHVKLKTKCIHTITFSSSKSARIHRSIRKTAVEKYVIYLFYTLPPYLPLLDGILHIGVWSPQVCIYLTSPRWYILVYDAQVYLHFGSVMLVSLSWFFWFLSRFVAETSQYNVFYSFLSLYFITRWFQ